MLGTVPRVRGRSWPTVAALLAAPALATAQPSDADILLRRAAELRDTGQYEQALRLVAQAAEREDSPRVTGERALCEVALGRWVEAEQHLVETLAAVDDAWVARRRLTLDTTLADVRQHLGRVDFGRAPPGATAEINGSSVGNLPLRAPARVASGDVTLVVRAPGHREYRRTVQVLGGATHYEDVLMEPIAPPTRNAPPTTACGPGLVLRDGLCYARTPPPELASANVGARLALWGGFAVALVAGGVATGLALDGDRSARDYAERCGGASPRASCLQEYSTTQEFLDGRAAVVNALIAIAGVGFVAGVTGLALELGAPRARARASLRVVPGAMVLRW